MANICTAKTSYQTGATSGAFPWTNPQNAVTFPGDAFTTANLALSSTQTSNGYLTADSITLTPEINAMPPSGDITSITVEIRLKAGVTSGFPNWQQICRIFDQSTGLALSSQQFTVGPVVAGGFVAYTSVFTTFINTGNADPTKLYCKDIQARKLYLRWQKSANPSTADGSLEANGINVIICYNEPVSSNVPLLFCEA
jgi:hypothetical protein